MKIVPVSKAEIREIVTTAKSSTSAYDKDEMAIPSYLHPNPLINWIVWRRHHILLNFAKDLPNKSVLDFGCGLGIFLPSLAENAQTVYAVDLFPEYAQELCRLRKLNVTIGTTLGIVEDNSLDYIFAAEVLEHIKDLDHMITIMAAKLKPGGAILLSLPTENFLYKIGRTLAGFRDKGDYHERNADQALHIIARNTSLKLTKKSYIPLPFEPSLYVTAHFEKVFSN